MKYTKNGVVVDAIQNDGTVQRFAEMRKMFGNEVLSHTKRGIEIMTWEGVKVARKDDWVIRGRYGNLLKLSGGIFQAEFKPVEDQ